MVSYNVVKVVKVVHCTKHGVRSNIVQRQLFNVVQGNIVRGNVVRGIA